MASDHGAVADQCVLLYKPVKHHAATITAIIAPAGNQRLILFSDVRAAVILWRNIHAMPKTRTEIAELNVVKFERPPGAGNTFSISGTYEATKTAPKRTPYSLKNLFNRASWLSCRLRD